jgi:ketosteroid isomerase-like protein
MRLSRHLALGLLCVSSLLCPPVWADDPQAAITQSYHAAEAAFNRKDVDSLLQFMTDDYKELSRDGQVMVTRSSFKSVTQKELDKLDTLTLHFNVGDIKVQGDSATVDVNSTDDATWHYKDQVHHQHTAVKRTDTWVNVGGKWRMQNTQVVQVDRS